MIFVDDRARVRHAFRTLTKRGWFARMNFACCTTCGFAEAPMGKPIVFYHHQNEAVAWNKGMLSDDGLYLAHDAQSEVTGAVTDEILQAFKNVGLGVDWDGSMSKKIHIVRGMSNA
jgi:hypothetical protein